MLQHDFSSSVTSTLFYTDVAIKHIHEPQVLNPKNKSVAVTRLWKNTHLLCIFIPAKDKQPCFIVIKGTC